MDPSHYYDRAQRLLREISQLEGRQADEQDKASRERSRGLRAASSIGANTSASIAASRQSESRRANERATDHDRRAADLGKQIASKRSQLADTQREAQRAEERQRNRDRTPNPRFGSFRGVGQAEAALSVVEREDEAPKRVVVGTLADASAADAVLDIARAGVYAMVSAVPVIGPVVREVIGTSWPDTRIERVERFAVELGRNVSAVQDRMDHEFVRKDEFRYDVEEAVERIILRRNQAKIVNFAAALAHSATVERPDSKIRHRFMDWLDQLRPIHIQILDRLLRTTSQNVALPDLPTPAQVAAARIQSALEGLDADSLDLTELQARGLIAPLDRDNVVLEVAEDASNLVTATGRAFLSFIADEGAPTPGSVAEGMRMRHDLPMQAGDESA